MFHLYCTDRQCRRNTWYHFWTVSCFSALEDERFVTILTKYCWLIKYNPFNSLNMFGKNHD